MFHGEEWDAGLKRVIAEGQRQERLDTQAAQARWKGCWIGTEYNWVPVSKEMGDWVGLGCDL